MSDKKKLPLGATLMQFALGVGGIAFLLAYVLGGLWQILPNTPVGAGFFGGVGVFLDDAIAVVLFYFLWRRVKKLWRKNKKE